MDWIGFLSAFSESWVSYMSGLVSVILAIVGAVLYSKGKSVPAWCFWTLALTCFVVASVKVWTIEHQRALTVEQLADKNSPKLSGVVDTAIVGNLQDNSGLHAALHVALLVGIRNQGTPSIAQGWKLRVTSPTVNVESGPVLIPDDFNLYDDSGKLIAHIPQSQHLEDKTMIPIAQGDYKRGWLRFILPNMTSQQYKESQKDLIFLDINEKLCHTDFNRLNTKTPLYYPGVDK
jgi:hypothetical protein